MLTDMTTDADRGSVFLIGTLATDVEVRGLDSRSRVGTFLLAVDRPHGTLAAVLIQVATRNRQADLCARHLGKGSRVAVRGRLRSRPWRDADGHRRSCVEVAATTVESLSPPRGQTAGFPKEATMAP